MSTGRVAIRADGSGTIGLGHVFRCLALGAALERAGNWPLYIGKNLGGIARILVEKRGFEWFAISDDASEALDAKLTVDICASHGIHVLFVDHYGIGSESHRFFRAHGLALALMDDEARRTDLECDLILNQNVGITPDHYGASSASVKLCGPKYALLREDFLPLRLERERREANGTQQGGSPHLVITLGGGDPANVTATVLRGARAVTKLGSVTVIYGPASDHAGRLDPVDAADPRVRVLTGPSDFARLLGAADLAVTAGGSTCYECAYLGVPNLIVEMADNQTLIARGMHEAGCSVYLGRKGQIEAAAIAEGLSRLVQERSARQRMAVAGKVLVDGMGAQRVGESLLALMPPAQG